MSADDAGIPRFAVVGRVNKGKSSILATLVEEADNARIRISEIPGETTRCQSIPLVLGGETLVEFIDTPGFNRARQALAWLREHHAEGSGEARIETVRRFVEAHRDNDEFQDERLLLEPVLEGAGVVYVVDASKPYRPDFGAEMEILRWTGRPRMAILNHLSPENDYSEEWRERLGESFNLTREFNAHRARFRERIRLLRHLLEIEEGNRAKLEQTIRQLEAEWDRRRSEAADIFIALLGRALTERVCENVGGDRVDRDYKRDEAERALKDRYRAELRELERRHHRRLIQLYKHGDAEFAEEVGDALLAGGDDLFAEETWQFLGLDPSQLALAGGLAGAAAGGSVDLATGGLTHGLGTLIGAAGGFFAAIWKGRKLAEIRVSNPLSPKGETAAGGVKWCAGPPKNPNFPWVLLDRALFHFEHLVTRAHGRRDRFVIDFNQLRARGEKHGYASRLTADRRRALQNWFGRLADRGREDSEDAEAFETLRTVLREIEEGELRVLEADD
ncbi:MAG: GTPase/DUF3482 domain-containing protein [Akkermansiaceae bacterium]|nr:GTPase/DUF3482 domain-containing protein [Akkermansiaceae bacterium]MCP5549795.1 GTPase/DUF3482 domain-containing protein [Akkermansiaceae bacterium]